MANSADPDQLASSEANWSGSTLFAKQDISGFSRTRVKGQIFLKTHPKRSIQENILFTHKNMLSPKVTICIKCQILISEKSK